MIPGYEQMKSFKEKVIDPVANAVGNAVIEMEKKAIQIGLQAYGVDPMTAKAAGEAVGAVQKSQMNAMKDIKKKNEEYKKEFEEFTK
jgi:AmiR/NasT family two-component response regulator